MVFEVSESDQFLSFCKGSSREFLSDLLLFFW